MINYCIGVVTRSPDGCVSSNKHIYDFPASCVYACRGGVTAEMTSWGLRKEPTVRPFNHAFYLRCLPLQPLMRMRVTCAGQTVTTDGHEILLAILLGSLWRHFLHSSSAHSHGPTCINSWLLEHYWMQGQDVDPVQTTSAYKLIPPDMIPRPTRPRENQLRTRIVPAGRHRNTMATMQAIMLSKRRKPLPMTLRNREFRKGIRGRKRKKVKTAKVTDRGSKTLTIRSGSRHDHISGSAALFTASPCLTVVLLPACLLASTNDIAIDPPIVNTRMTRA